MKYIIVFLVLISLAFCQPSTGKTIPKEEEVFADMKKLILECIIKSEKASPEMKKYAAENLNAGPNETLNLAQFINNESDRFIIRQCKREAFLLATKKNKSS